MSWRRFRRALGLLLAVIVPSGCFVSAYTYPSAHPVGGGGEQDRPVHAQMFDGSIVLFEHGAVYSDGELRGEGRQFDLALQEVATRHSVPLDSVVVARALEARPLDPGQSMALTLGNMLFGLVTYVVLLAPKT